MSEPGYAELHADGSPREHRRPQEAEVFAQYAAIIRRLRAEDGCPWDKKQTLHSLRRYIVEEAFEVLAAINDSQKSQDSHHSPHGHYSHHGDDGGIGGSAPLAVPATDYAAADYAAADYAAADYAAVADELGDVLLVSLLLADALEQETGTPLSEVLNANGQKLIRRHPHVFGSVDATTAEQVVTNWNQIKKDQEGRSISVAHVSRGLPPLERAYEVQKKASAVGFDWETIDPAMDKLKEEIEELEQRLAELKARAQPTKDNSQVEEELGDVLFSVVNVSRHLKTDPSVALARTNDKFLDRFRYVEEQIASRGLDLSEAGLETLDKLWDEAKEHERSR